MSIFTSENLSLMDHILGFFRMDVQTRIFIAELFAREKAVK